MNRWIGLVAFLALSGTAYADHGAESVRVWGYEAHHGRFVEEEPDHRLVVERDPYGRTRIKVISPEQGVLHVLQDGREVYVDELPTVFDAQPRTRYLIQVVLPNGQVWVRPVETQVGAVSKLWVNQGSAPYAEPGWHAAAPVMQPPQPPPPPAPAAMSPDRFAALAQAVEQESFPQNKLGVLRTAVQREYFTCAQLGALMDLMAFPNDKVESARILRPRILDPENAFTLNAHLTFPNDREQVQKLFR